jgi:hypothetical protein
MLMFRLLLESLRLLLLVLVIGMLREIGVPLGEMSHGMLPLRQKAGNRSCIFGCVSRSSEWNSKNNIAVSCVVVIRTAYREVFPHHFNPCHVNDHFNVSFALSLPLCQDTNKKGAAASLTYHVV